MAQAGDRAVGEGHVTSLGRRPSGQQQHRVAELVPQVRRRAAGREVGVRRGRRAPGPATASSRCRWLASGSCSPVSRPSTTRAGRSGPSTSDVQPSVRPSAAVSRARTTVVPTASTRPPACLVSFTSRAVWAGTENHSGCGGSCDSWLATPGVQDERRDDDARGHQVHQELAGQRPPGARHLGAARAGRRTRSAGPPARPAARGRSSGSGDRARRGSRPGRPAAGSSPRQSRVCPSGCGHVDAQPHAAGQRQRPRPARASGARGRPARRSSTTHAPSSSSVETCTAPYAVSTAAGRVALVFTTSRSPGSSQRGRSRATACSVPPGVTTASRTSSRARPRASGVTRGGGDAHAGTPRDDTARSDGAVAAAGQVAVDAAPAGRARPTPARAGRRCPRRGTRPGASASACRRGRRRRPAAAAPRRPAPGDAWSSPALADAVAAPGLVGLDRGVGADVEDDAGVPAQLRQERGGQGQRRDQVDLQQPEVRRRVEVGERRQRARAQRARVVDQQPGAAELGRDVDELAAVRRVGHVPGDGRVRPAGRAPRSPRRGRRRGGRRRRGSSRATRARSRGRGRAPGRLR